MATASKSSRTYLIRKGLAQEYGWSDTKKPVAAPAKAPFHVLPVPEKAADPVRELIQHQHDQTDHGQTTW